jgi:hypothetical protein
MWFLSGPKSKNNSMGRSKKFSNNKNQKKIKIEI